MLLKKAPKLLFTKPSTLNWRIILFDKLLDNWYAGTVRFSWLLVIDILATSIMYIDMLKSTMGLDFHLEIEAVLEPSPCTSGLPASCQNV